MVVSNGIGKDRPYQARLYTQCMQSKGYQWIVETRVSLPVKNASILSASIAQCSNGRLITHASGYQKCVFMGAKDGGILQAARRVISPRPNLAITRTPRPQVRPLAAISLIVKVAVK